MTDNQTPPDWAFKRAQELRTERGFTHLDAFAAYIAKHEQPPVDRKLLCAREAQGSMFIMVGSLDPQEIAHNRKTAEQACIRAIELWEEGFGG